MEKSKRIADATLGRDVVAFARASRTGKAMNYRPRQQQALQLQPESWLGVRNREEIINYINKVGSSG